MASFFGCGRIERRSQLDGVRRAALKIQSRTATGVSLIEYPQVVSELAFELLLAKDQALDAPDVEAVKKFAEALETYMAVKDVWEANQKYFDCLHHSDEKFCRDIYGSSVIAASSKAHVDSEVGFSADAVPRVWQVAEGQVEEAEDIRQGRPTNTKKSQGKR